MVSRVRSHSVGKPVREGLSCDFQSCLSEAFKQKKKAEQLFGKLWQNLQLWARGAEADCGIFVAIIGKISSC